MKELNFLKVRQETETDGFFLISLKNNQLCHKELQNSKLFQTHFTREDYSCLLNLSLVYVLKDLKIEMTFLS